MKENNLEMITVLGPTAAGKTKLAAHIGFYLNGAVLSADSRQVYKGMNIGSGKDYKDYIVHGEIIPSYLVDIRNAGEKYNLFEFQKDFFNVYNELKQNNVFPILCGGTGLYIEAATKAYQMKAVPPNTKLRKELENHSLKALSKLLEQLKKTHNKSDIDSKKRAIRAIEIAMYQKENPAISAYPKIKNQYVGIIYDRSKQRDRITKRLSERLEEGMIDEVRDLLNNGIQPQDLVYYGLEYKYITMYITGEISQDEMFKKLNTAIHQFAKRQVTWFRKMERSGDSILWLNGELELKDKLEKVKSILSEDLIKMWESNEYRP